jgi:hypothetical protein
MQDRHVRFRARTGIVLLGALLVGGCGMLGPRHVEENAHQPRFWVEVQEEEEDGVTFGITIPWSN